jgi:hypothetical protein
MTAWHGRILILKLVQSLQLKVIIIDNFNYPKFSNRISIFLKTQVMMKSHAEILVRKIVQIHKKIRILYKTNMHKSKIVIKKKKVLIHWKELTIQMMIHNKMRIKKIQISIFLLILLKAQENSIKSEIQIML